MNTLTYFILLYIEILNMLRKVELEYEELQSQNVVLRDVEENDTRQRRRFERG